MHVDNISWEIIFAIGAMLLFVGLVYGSYQSRRRRKSVEPVTDAATRKQYAHPEEYDEKEQERLRREADARS